MVIQYEYDKLEIAMPYLIACLVIFRHGFLEIIAIKIPEELLDVHDT